ITRSQSSTLILRTVRSMVMPALLTRMSRRPCWSNTSSMTRSQSAAIPLLPWRMVAPSCSAAKDRGVCAHGGDAAAPLAPACAEPAADRQSEPSGAAGDERDLTVHAGHRGALPSPGGLPGDEDDLERVQGCPVEVVAKLDRLTIFVVGDPLHGQQRLAPVRIEQPGLGGAGPSGPDGLGGQVEADPGGPPPLGEGGSLQ